MIKLWKTEVNTKDSSSTLKINTLKKRYPHTLLQSIILFAFGFVFGIPVLFISDYLPKSVAISEIIVFAFSAIPIIFMVLFALYLNKRNGLTTAFNGRLKINHGLAALGCTVISVQLIVAPLIEIITKFFSLHNSDELYPGIIYIIGIIFLSPLMEELLFRGIFLAGMLENYSPRKAILLTTAFFALVHGNILHIIVAFLGGLLLGYTFYKTRSIVLGILLHMMVNSTGMLSHLFHTTNKTSTFLTAYGQYSWLVYGIAIIGLIVGCYFLIKRQMFAKYLAEYESYKNNYIDCQRSTSDL